MGSNRQRQAKEFVRELCVAHNQVIKDLERHKKEGRGSQIVLDMYEQKIRELESQITANVKSLQGIEALQEN